MNVAPARTAGGSRSLTISLVGTRGVPARYGGFETCVEEVGSRLADRGHAVTVYSRNGNRRPGDPERYRGMGIVHLPALRKRSLETLSHSALSVAHLGLHRPDVALVFNAANAPLLPFGRALRGPVATHVDGLEWQRAKWGPVGTRYYKAVERMAVRFSDALIADAQGIADYYRHEFDSDTDLISYGAPAISDSPGDRLAELGLVPDGYHLVVARFEPENHVDVIVDGYVASEATLPLIVVGSAPYSDAYTEKVHAAGDTRVRFLGGVWDQDLLDQLYAHARTYLHGHSVGGTNPSLLRAIGAGTATIAWDVGFNREVLQDAGRYFAARGDLARLVESAETDLSAIASQRSRALERAARYDWEDVTDRYEALCRRLVDQNHRARPSRKSPPPPTSTPTRDVDVTFEQRGA